MATSSITKTTRPTDIEKLMSENSEEPKKRGFLGLLQSTVAAIFGIQSDENRKKDFASGDASQFITMGIIAVVVLVVTMIIVVNQVLDSAGQ